MEERIRKAERKNQKTNRKEKEKKTEEKIKKQKRSKILKKIKIKKRKKWDSLQCLVPTLISLWICYFWSLLDFAPLTSDTGHLA